MGNGLLEASDDNCDYFCDTVHDAALLLCSDGFGRPQMDETKCGTDQNGSDDRQFENATCRQIGPPDPC